MGYVFEDTSNPVIKGVVHLAWKEVSGAYPRKINLVCSGAWVSSKTPRTRRDVTCLACLTELLQWGEESFDVADV